MSLKTILPSEPEAERVVLGALLSGDTDLADEIMPLLAAEDFYDPAHPVIWRAMLEARQAGMRIDLLTVSERLNSTGQIAKLAGRGHESYLSGLAVEIGPTREGTADHAKLIKETSTLRRLAFLGQALRDAAVGRAQSSGDLLAQCSRQLLELAAQGIVNPVQHVKPLANQALATIEHRFNHKSAIVGTPSGLREFDAMTAGYRAGDLVIIAARPSMGKTAFVVGSAVHAAENEHPALIFSLEMSKEALVERCIAHDARVDSGRMQTGYLDSLHWRRITESIPRLVELPLYMDDTARQTVSTIGAKSRQWVRECVKPGQKALIAIDYLQLVTSEDTQERRKDLQIGGITKGLKALAKELGVPIVVLSQLSRKVEDRGDKRPQNSDLKESGAIEEDADLICFIYRDEFYKPDTEDKGVAELIIGKQRNGPTGTARVRFFKEFTRFENLSHRSDQ